ncbi:HNH endonuclease domain-containing protein [Sporosarcina sp. 6E9]|uniref:HNH endonuclease domain-containing protein n=1 Tax=Sporosarcina sp. 6E9 TaxID=2819235 RepID=UPI001B312A5E|nr:HNH endonuclease domain-containing protein [Sporosarcina sp. 6E9]
MNNYELTKFIQSRNESHSDEVIINHIENITKRESLIEYRELLLTYSEPRCFYTNATLVEGKSKVVVDHFIPWSFVHSGNLWNFVLTTPSLNSRKGSKLPSNEYINKLFQRNELLTNVKDQNVREEFAKYKESTVEKLYGYAEINGFQTGWTP